MELLKQIEFTYKTEEERINYLENALLNPEEYFEKKKSSQGWDDGDYPDVVVKLFRALPDANQGIIWEIAQCQDDALDFIWQEAIGRIHSPLKLLFLKVRLHGMEIFDQDAVEIVKKRYIEIFDQHNLASQSITI